MCGGVGRLAGQRPYPRVRFGAEQRGWPHGNPVVVVGLERPPFRFDAVVHHRADGGVKGDDDVRPWRGPEGLPQLGLKHRLELRGLFVRVLNTRAGEEAFAGFYVLVDQARDRRQRDLAFGRRSTLQPPDHRFAQHRRADRPERRIFPHQNLLPDPARYCSATSQTQRNCWRPSRGVLESVSAGCVLQEIRGPGHALGGWGHQGGDLTGPGETLRGEDGAQIGDQ